MKYESLRYFDICRQEGGRNYQFYFDAVDVIRILQGVNRFYKGERGEIYARELFEEDTPIVHALAFGKFLKEGIRLLPPHQAELARVIQQSNNGNSFVFFRKLDREGNRLKIFLERDLKFFDKLRDMTNPGSKEMNDSVIKSWIDDKNKEIFKAIFLSYKANYAERLQELFSNGVIRIEQYSLEDIQIHDDDLFFALTDAFKANRPQKEDGGSNFSDVASLMFLARMVKAYNADNSNPLPVYFDSHDYLSYIPEQIMDKYFKIVTVPQEGEESIPSYALRNHDFFRIYALENYSSAAATGQEVHYRELIRSGESADNLQKSFDMPTLKKEIPEVGRWYQKENKELRGKILDYVEVDFFKTVIYTLQKTRPAVINKILLDFQREELNPETAEVIDTRNKLILEYIGQEINDLLRETVNMYNEIFWRVKSLTSVARRLKEENETLDIFFHFSLFRFLIPKKFQVNLRHFFSEDGLLSADAANSSRLTLWNLYYRTVYYRHNKGIMRKRLLDLNDLYTLYGSFWILSLHDKLIDFHAKEEYLEVLDHSLLMIIGASLDRVISSVKQGDLDMTRYHTLYVTIIRILEGRLGAETKTPVDIDIHHQIKVVLSYLYFHLWIQQGNVRLLAGRDYKPQRINFSEDCANYKAVEFARDALTYFESGQSKSNNAIYLYAFNIYVYYVIDTAPDDEFRKIGSLRNEFIALQGTSRDWHFRYDDTVARNFHRLAEMVDSKESKLENIKRAIQVLEACMKKYQALDGRDIHEVRVYLNTLANIKGGLEI